MLFHLFNKLRESVPGANVFRYVSTRIGLATLTSLLITFLVAPWFIRRARERQLGEVIRDDGPASHKSKVGTPTMGGALIIMALVAATLLWCDLGSTVAWLFAGDAFAPEIRLHLAPPLVNFHHHSLVLPLLVYVAFGLFVVIGSSQ